jgi:hypothetical protein
MNWKENNMSQNLNFEHTDQSLACLPSKMHSELSGMNLWHQGGYFCQDAAILRCCGSTFSSHFHSCCPFLLQVKEEESD